MRITRNFERPKTGYVSGNHIPRGTVFDGNIGGHSGPFLRSYDRIISLENPDYTWDLGGPVVNYLPLDVELVVHGPSAEEGRL